MAKNIQEGSHQAYDGQSTVSLLKDDTFALLHRSCCTAKQSKKPSQKPRRDHLQITPHADSEHYQDDGWPGCEP